MAGVVEVEHRARAGGGGRAGRDQDGAGAAARAASADAARGRAEPARGVVGQRAVAVAGGPGVAAGGVAGAPGGRVVVRHQRDQRARRHRGSAARGGGRGREAPPLVPGAVASSARLRYRLLVSGRDEAALRAQADRYAEWLSRSPDADWSAVLGTAALHRTHFEARASISARDDGGGDGSAASAGRWASASGGVAGKRRASGVEWCSCSRGRAAQWRSDGSSVAGGVARCLPRPLRLVTLR